MRPVPGASQVVHLESADSTQSVARVLADNGASDRTVVWADSQTAGRGRMERRWQSPLGGLYFSLIVRPRFPPSRLAELSLAAGAAIAAGLRHLTDLETAVKAPNDVLVVTKSGRRKICGILTEASGSGKKLDWVLIGVGVNVNNRTHGLPEATSLLKLTRRRWNIEGVLRVAVRALDETLKKLD